MSTDLPKKEPSYFFVSASRTSLNEEKRPLVDAAAVKVSGDEVKGNLRNSRSTHTENRFSKAKQWHNLHRELARVSKFTHNLNTRIGRPKLGNRNSRGAISANNIRSIETPDAATSFEFNETLRSCRRLQREAVVYSDSNSRNGSKNYSLDSAKSDGIIQNTGRTDLAVVIPLDSSVQQAPNYLPAVTLTVPTEDSRIIRRNETDPIKSCAFPAIANFSFPSQQFCEFCALSTPTILEMRRTTSTTCSIPPIFRRHSHCGSPTTSEEAANCCRDDLFLCNKCNRPCQKNMRSGGSFLYPPTRNRNASCSGIDMLADAILQANADKRQRRHQVSEMPCESPQPQQSTRSQLRLTSVSNFRPNQLFKITGRVSPQRQAQLHKPQARWLKQGGDKLVTTDAVNQEKTFGEIGTVGNEFPELSSRPLAEAAVSSRPTVILTPSEIKHAVGEPKAFDPEKMKLAENVVEKDVKVIGSKRSEKRLLRHAQAEATSFEGTSDNSLKVPMISHLVPAVPKRPTHSDEEPSLDSRIRRVSMILMSRQHQSQNESKCLTQLEHGDALTSHTVDNEGAALHPEMSTARDLPRTITTRQITEEWPLVSLSEDKKKIPIVKSIDRTEISYMPIKQPNVKPDIHQMEEDMRFRRSRRQTERFSKGIGYHLGRRRRLLELRRRMADFSLAFGLFGIFAAFLDTELVARALYSKDSIYSIIVRVLISVSTVILMALILSYHAYDIMIFLCEEYIKDWRISVTKRRVLQVTIELIICSIHPTPGINLFYYKPQAAKPITSFHPRLHDAPLLEDSFSPYLLLVLPMIGRLYLAFRALLLHSKMFNDAGSRSIGAMNKVSFDLRFVLKTLMTVCPLKSLLIFIFTIWIILSWTLRACELEQGENHLGLLNSAWLISVTFLSIGYGDIVPHTSCGRLVAVTTGLMGSACTALLVAVFSHKLEMSKAEKHVLHFMEANRITKRVKNCAANVLRETWLLYKNAKLMPHFNRRRVRAHQRKFLQAIYSLRTSKVKQRELQDKSDSLVDLAKLQTNVFEGVADIALRQDAFQQQLDNIERNLTELKNMMRAQSAGRPHHFQNV